MQSYRSAQIVNYVPTDGLLEIENGGARNLGCLLEIIHQLFHPNRHNGAELSGAFESIDEEYLEFLSARLTAGLKNVQTELASRRLADPRI